MKTENKALIEKLGRLGVLDVEQIQNNYWSSSKKDEDSIIIENTAGVKCKVITENVNDEDLPLMIAAEQLATLKYIKSVVKGYVIGCCVILGIWLLTFLIELGSHM